VKIYQECPEPHPSKSTLEESTCRDITILLNSERNSKMVLPEYRSENSPIWVICIHWLGKLKHWILDKGGRDNCG